MTIARASRRKALKSKKSLSAVPVNRDDQILTLEDFNTVSTGVEGLQSTQTLTFKKNGKPGIIFYHNPTIADIEDFFKTIRNKEVEDTDRLNASVDMVIKYLANKDGSLMFGSLSTPEERAAAMSKAKSLLGAAAAIEIAMLISNRVTINLEKNG